MSEKLAILRSMHTNVACLLELYLHCAPKQEWNMDFANAINTALQSVNVNLHLLEEIENSNDALLKTKLPEECEAIASIYTNVLEVISAGSKQLIHTQPIIPME